MCVRVLVVVLGSENRFDREIQNELFHATIFTPVWLNLLEKYMSWMVEHVNFCSFDENIIVIIILNIISVIRFNIHIYISYIYMYECSIRMNTYKYITE